MKAKYRSKYNEWTEDANNRYYTVNGNLMAPPYNTVLSWLSKSWEALDRAAIIKSFRDCGINSEMDEFHTFLREFLENDLESRRENVYIVEDDSEHEMDEVAFIRYFKIHTVQI